MDKTPAFPSGRRFEISDGWQTEDGMTLRDYFAAKAIIAYHADGNFSATEDVANWCYRLADAMMEARK